MERNIKLVETEEKRKDYSTENKSFSKTRKTRHMFKNNEDSNFYVNNIAMTYENHRTKYKNNKTTLKTIEEEEQFPEENENSVVIPNENSVTEKISVAKKNVTNKRYKIDNIMLMKSASRRLNTWVPNLSSIKE